MAKLEELQNLKPGDQIIINDPILKKKEPYALMTKIEGMFSFISSYKASFMIKDQETIDAFNVEIISEDHELWNNDLYMFCQLMDSLLGNLN